MSKINKNWFADYRWLAKHIMLLLIMVNFYAVTAQNITVVEYFFDTDPGYGSGTSVAITPATAITNFTFPINITAQSDGFHTLFVRVKDANNNWSAAYSRPFYKLSSSPLPPVPNINKLEYFIDADPGYGAGTNVAITPGVSIPDLSVPVPVTAIAEGNHTITFRARDANNNWSVVAIKSFSKCNHPTTTINAAASITSSGFTASWADVPGSIGYRLDVSADNFNTFVSGYNSKVVTAPALSSVVTGLAQATTYQYRVRAVASCTSVESNTENLTTLATPPSAQPTNFLFSSVTSTSLTAFFTAPSTAPTGYLVVRKVGSASTFTPTNNTSYTLGQDIGDGVVAYSGTTFLFNETGLTPDTQYFYRVFAYNQVSTSISYLTTSPLQSNVRTVALEPTAQPTNLQFASVTDVGFTVSYTAATGSPTGYLVLRKVGSAPTSTPVDGTAYTTTVGTDAVVYNGAATTFPQTGLTQNTTYFYAVYAYNGSGTSLNYRVTTPLQGSQLTQISPPASAPTGLLFSNVTASSISVAFTAATGSPSGYLVVRKPSLSSTFAPQPNTLYTTGQVLLDGTVAYVGSSLNFIDNSLLANTTYFYDVFAYNQLGSQISYQSVAPLEGSRSTLAAEPATQPTSITFSSLAATGFTVSYTAATDSPSGYLAVRSTSVTPVFVPVDGTTYSVGTQGSEFISFIGAGNLFAETGLSTNTRYYYAIYAFNGSGATINYRSTSPLTGDQLTLLVAPTVQPTNITFNAVTSSAMSVGFTAAVGVSGYVVVRSSGASPTFVPQNNVSYTIGTQTGGEIVSVGTSTSGISNSGLAASTEYFYRVYAYNQNGAQISYNVISPLEGSRSTLAAEPAAQPTSITFSSLAATGFTVSYTAATGSPSGYLAVRSTSVTPVFVPVDGTTYSVGIQGSEFISFIGAGNLFAETGLSTNTRYYYAIYAFNGSGATINYRSTSPLTGDQLTLLVAPTVQPTNITFNAVTSSAMTVGFTAAAGVSGYVVVRSSGASPTFIPQNNVSYSIGTQTGGEIVSVGTSTSGISNSGLAASTEYFYRVFSYNQNGAQISYNIISPLAGSKFTFTAEPTTQASALVFSNPTMNSLAINFTAASPAPAGYLIIRKAGIAATGLPSDGQSYALLDVIGDGVVAYIGTATSFVDNGLLAGTTYFYQVFSFNGAGILTNYLTTVNASNSGSKITVPGKPETPTASLVGQNQLTVNWIATTGADNYRLDVSKDNFVTRVSGFDNLAVNALTQPVSGLEPGTAYKFKVRAVNTSGTSVNSDEVQQFTIPATPVLTAATSVEQFAFTANWNLVTGATNYFIDVSLVNDFSTFLTGYQNKQMTNVSSEVITGLDAGKTYFYRLRSKNDGGPSPNSTSQNQLLLPATPVGSDATNQQSNSFKANWQAAQGATSYLLDVSLASTNFSPSLPNYTNKPIPLGTSDIVSNLSPSTEYRYRVRAVNASGASPSSVPIPVSTIAPPSGIPLQLSNVTYPNTFTSSSANISVDASGGTPGYTVVFYFRKITSSSYTPTTITSVGTNYKATIEAAMFDEIGLEFYFKITDAIGDTRETTKNFVYLALPTAGQNIPFSKSGGTKESYELFSIPYQLADNSIANIFEELGAPNKAKYWLLRYQGGKNVDYGDGLTKIELGKGYWFNSKENVSINFSGGTVSQNNQSTDFILRLESGWNQIGNPFTLS